MLDQSTRHFSFSGHESFPFRYTWPTKAVRKLQGCADLFTRDDAIVTLGVGKNMVGSIRHWADTLGLIERADTQGHMQPTTLGKALLGEQGWDPYLENPGTLWLLHWLLVARRDRASSWHLAFTRWNTDGFSRDKLADWLMRTSQDAGGSPATPASIQRDVDVFVRTYVPAFSRQAAVQEDSFDCPLVELALVHEIERGTYQFVRGPKPTLPDSIFLFALLNFWQRYYPNQNTISYETILHGPGSPGAAFKLTENALAERLERLPAWSGLRYDETAGMRQVLRQETIPPPVSALEHYYELEADAPTMVGAYNG